MTQKHSSNPIRSAREVAGKTQTRLAWETRLSLSTIRLAEQGLATTRTLAAIAKALGVEVHALRAPSEAA